jgi:ribose-phosphate pyrophosphokinase
LFVSKETVRNKNVFIVASSSTPVNENIIQLLIFVDSLKRASAKSITVILAYYGYSRQDRKIMGRQPIAAKLIADLLEKSGVTKLISCDLHNPSIQGFFNIPVDDLKGQYILAPSIKKIGKFTIASPDHGGAVRARILSEILSDSIEIAIVDKRRTKPNQTETMGILGDVKNKNIVILDDIIDTGQTIIKATHALKKVGAKNIVVAASHGIFTKGFNLFEDCKYIDKVLITDSIEHVYELEKKHKKLKVVSIAKMIALTIEAIINSKSISIIYEKMFNKINKT